MQTRKCMDICGWLGIYPQHDPVYALGMSPALFYWIKLAVEFGYEYYPCFEFFSQAL